MRPQGNSDLARAFGLHRTDQALDASGHAAATVQVPKLSPVLIGTRLYPAYVVFLTSFDYASTPVPSTLVR